MSKTLTIAILDPRGDSANAATAFRIMAAALARGMNVNVVAEDEIAGGASMSALGRLAAEKGVSLERVSRASGDLLKRVEGSANTLVIPNR